MQSVPALCEREVPPLGTPAGFVRWTPDPVVVTIRDNRDYMRVLLYYYYTTITGWGVLLRDLSAYLEGLMGHLVTRLILGILRITIWVVGVMNPLTKSP